MKEGMDIFLSINNLKWSFIGLVSMVFLIFPFHSQAESEKEKFMIVMKNGKEAESLAFTLSKDITLLKSFPILTGEFSSEEIEMIKDHPSVMHIERDQIVNIEKQEKNWGLEEIGIEQTSWKMGYTGKGVKISILDSGIDTTHEDLHVSGGTTFWGETYNDDLGHGTHVAGIIGALNNTIGTVGVAPDAELYAVKVINGMGWGLTSDIVKGLNWAIENDMDIINMSLGFPKGSQAMQTALSKVKESGITVIAAAGNDGGTKETTSTVKYPAKYSSVIAVSAINKDKTRSAFSSTGKEVEFSAPGKDIKSTFPNNSYGLKSGTSMAAPFVSGLAALYLQANPGDSPDDIRNKMRENVIDLGEKGRDPLYGYGLVQPLDFDTKEFKDVKTNHWAYSSIMETVKRGWMVGKTKNQFFPEDPITRAQTAVVLRRSLPLSNPTDPDRENFPDVPDEYWASQAILVMKQQEIFKGDLDGKFNPNENLTRAQMATAISRAISLEKDTFSSLDFRDIPKRHWANEHIKKVVGKGIFHGYKDGTFRPNKIMTRAETAEVLIRLYSFYTKNEEKESMNNK